MLKEVRKYLPQKKSFLCAYIHTFNFQKISSNRRINLNSQIKPLECLVIRLLNKDHVLMKFIDKMNSYNFGYKFEHIFKSFYCIKDHVRKKTHNREH